MKNKKLNSFKTSSLQQPVALHNMPRKTQEWLDALNRANASHRDSNEHNGIKIHFQPS